MFYKQRKSFEEGSLSEDKINELNKIGFVWDPLEETWNDMCEELIIYKEQYGNCLVPATYVQNKKNLGIWVIRQRIVKEQS